MVLGADGRLISRTLDRLVDSLSQKDLMMTPSVSMERKGENPTAITHMTDLPDGILTSRKSETAGKTASPPLHHHGYNHTQHPKHTNTQFSLQPNMCGATEDGGGSDRCGGERE